MTVGQPGRTLARPPQGGHRVATGDIGRCPVYDFTCTVDSVVTFQERSTETIAEMRKLSTQNSAEIREAVEDAKKPIARLIADADTLPAPA